MLVVGLITVITWDATFPDRRDVMVLSPLPIAPLTILCAKVSASLSVLGLAVLMLNLGTGLVYPSLLGTLHGWLWGVPRFFAAYWFTMAATSLFVYGSVLSVQGFTALLLPRRIFPAAFRDLAAGCLWPFSRAVFLFTDPADPGGVPSA